MIRHVVRAGDPRVLADIVRDAEAIADGRVFVGKKRADGTERLADGDVITIHAPKERVAVEILAQHDGFIAINKPAGIPTVPDQSGSAHSLLALAIEETGIRSLHATSRLDHGVSGIVVFATNADANERQLEARRNGEYKRRYFGIACGTPHEAWGEWTAPIGRAKNPKLRAANGRDHKPARSHYWAMGEGRDHTALLLVPETGRTHQLRVHASHAGLPLLGDRDYGGKTRIVTSRGSVLAVTRVALHCARVAFTPFGEVISPLPPDLLALWDALRIAQPIVP